MLLSAVFNGLAMTNVLMTSVAVLGLSLGSVAIAFQGDSEVPSFRLQDEFFVSFEAAEIYQKLPEAMATDPRHVYPLLAMVADDQSSGLYVRGSMSQVTVPRAFTAEDASTLISFAFDDSGVYNGMDAFSSDLREYLMQTGLHLQDIVIVDIEFTEFDDGGGSVRLVTSERDATCRSDSDASFEELLQLSPATVISFESARVEPYDGEHLTIAP